MSEALLDATEVSKHFGGVHALIDVGFSIRRVDEDHHVLGKHTRRSLEK